MNAIEVRTDVATVTQYLTFFIGDEEYALGIMESREILQYQPVTAVPSMPPSIRGVMNLRGNVVPVVDLALLFGLDGRPTTKWTCVVVVETAQRGGGGGGPQVIGIVVDSVSQVIEFGPDDIEPAPAFGTHVLRHFLRGMAKGGRKFVLLLDLERVIAALEFERAVESHVGDRQVALARGTLLGEAPTP